MQAIMETAFSVLYLLSAVVMGSIMLKNGFKYKNQEIKTFGLMTLLLAFGDSFHLIPRIYALNVIGLENNVKALGFGTFMASITMTIFYLMLYKVWKLHYHKIDTKALDVSLFILALARIILCFLPQNKWLSPDSPLNFAILRNIPFLIIGAILLVIFKKQSKSSADDPYKNIWIAILLSFLFYMPVVLFADKYPLVGMLMLPKTLAYVWIIVMGYQNMLKIKQTLN